MGDSLSMMTTTRGGTRWEKWRRLLFGDHRDPRRVLAEEFGAPVPESGTPPREALQWARETLDAAQVDASQDQVGAIRVLRREKDLGLSTTKYLTDHLRKYR